MLGVAPCAGGDGCGTNCGTPTPRGGRRPDRRGGGRDAGRCGRRCRGRRRGGRGGARRAGRRGRCGIGRRRRVWRGLGHRRRVEVADHEGAGRGRAGPGLGQLDPKRVRAHRTGAVADLLEQHERPHAGDLDPLARRAGERDAVDGEPRCDGLGDPGRAARLGPDGHHQLGDRDAPVQEEEIARAHAALGDARLAGRGEGDDHLADVAQRALMAAARARRRSTPPETAVAAARLPSATSAPTPCARAASAALADAAPSTMHAAAAPVAAIMRNADERRRFVIEEIESGARAHRNHGR